MKNSIRSASLFAAVLSGLTIATSAFAEEKSAEYNLKFEKSPKVKKSEYSAFNNFRFGVSGPLMIAGGEAFIGGSYFGLKEVSPNILLGGETGFYYWSTSSSSVSASQWIIPLLGTALYRFDSESSTLTPYIGASIGAAIVNASVNVGGFSGSGTEAQLEFLARGGLIFGEKQNVTGEVKLGLIGSTFVLIPSIGYIF